MLQITITGEQDVLDYLATVRSGLQNTAPIVEAGLKILSESVLQNIAQQGRPGYPDILPSSRASRKFDQSSPPLWDSGAMAQAASATEGGVDGSTYFLDPDGDLGTIGVDDLFHGARRHQFGYGGPDTLGRSFDEPARSFMVMQEDDEVAIIELFDVWIGDLVEL